MQLISRPAARVFANLLVTLCLGSPAGGWAGVGLSADTSTFGTTIFVHPTGTPSENAATLLAAILSPTATAATAEKPVLIAIGPGTFDFGDPGDLHAILMPDSVDLRGAGPGATMILCDCPGTVILVNGTVNQFSQLTLENVNSNARSLDVIGSSLILIDRIESFAEYGLRINNNGSAIITNSRLVSTLDDALQLSGSSAEVTISHSIIEGGDSSNDGLVFGSAFPTLISHYNLFDGGGVGLSAGFTDATCLASTTASSFTGNGCP